MAFFQGQETLTSIEWVLRAVVAFLFLMIVAKAMGQRAISQLRLIDFVIALVIGNIIAHPLSDEHLGMKGSIITSIVLVGLYSGGVFLKLRCPRFRRLISSKPIIIVKDGEILHKELKKARISIDILLEELREGKVKDVKNVALAIWEADGKISFFLDPKYEPITNSSLQIQTEPFDFPRIIIKEGIINYRELGQIDKDEDWILSNLEGLYHTDVKNVLLATLDKKGTMRVFLYK